MRYLLLIAAMAASVVGAAADAPLVLIRSIELPRVEGRIDHLSIDTTARRLFVAALASNTVEAIDLGAGKVERSLAGFHEPQGIGQPLESTLVAVANGGSGDLVMFARDNYRVMHTVRLGDDADNVRFDRRTGRFYVGYGSGAIGVVSQQGERVGEVALAAHPESFQLEGTGARIFVNVPGARQISVIDRDALKLLATWPVISASANYPMALDEATHRLFVGCRRPAVVLTFDTESGKQLSSADTVGDTDDMFYDAKRKRLYVIGGDGFVDVFERDGADRLRRAGRVATAAGARTGLFVPDEDVLYVAAPHRGSQRAEIRAYEAR
jgi:DNA-binding beta-propeller fold protein YncE